MLDNTQLICDMCVRVGMWARAFARVLKCGNTCARYVCACFRVEYACPCVYFRVGMRACVGMCEC